MKLTVQERLVLLELLPQVGSYPMLKLMRQARERLSFSEEEYAKYKFEETPEVDGRTRIKWDTTIPQEKEITLSERIKALVVETLSKLNEANKLTEREFSLYEKFVEPSAD